MLRHTALWAALGLALLTTGCGDLISLHPLYMPDERLLDPAIEGRWEDEEAVLTLKRDGNGYAATFRAKTPATAEEQEYEVRLVDIAGVRMADIILTGGEIGHMFVRVRVQDTELRFAFLDSPWVRQRLPHEVAEVARGNTLAVLVAPTAELRKQVEKYAQVPEAYDEELVYRRVTAGASGKQ